MDISSNRLRGQLCGARRARALCGIEQLENRQMLTTSADIVFLVDESASDPFLTVQSWLNSIVDDLDTELENKGVDAHYGLVGFGEYLPNDAPRFAHSQLVDPDQSLSTEQLFTDDVNELIAGIGNLASSGGDEDGWDALEHAIAEYDFRENAVPVLVLIQNEEAQTPLNRTLTRTGVLAALESKNVILNTLTVGRNRVQADGTAIFDSTKPVFDLSPYETVAGAFDDIRILGVEADSVDGFDDRSHTFHHVDVDLTNNGGVPEVPTATESEALQISFNGSNTGKTGMVGSGKSLIIGQAVSDGLGPTVAGYRGDSVPFEYFDLVSPTTFSGPISYSFDFYGNRTQVWADEDGLLRFTATDIDGANADLSHVATGLPGEPTPPPRPSQAAIPVLWDDLAPITTGGLNGTIEWEVRDIDGNQQDDLLVQWSNYRYVEDVDDGMADPISFQAVLCDDGTII